MAVNASSSGVGLLGGVTVTCRCRCGGLMVVGCRVGAAGCRWRVGVAGWRVGVAGCRCRVGVARCRVGARGVISSSKPRLRSSLAAARRWEGLNPLSSPCMTFTRNRMAVLPLSVSCRTISASCCSSALAAGPVARVDLAAADFAAGRPDGDWKESMKSCASLNPIRMSCRAASSWCDGLAFCSRPCMALTRNRIMSLPSFVSSRTMLASVGGRFCVVVANMRSIMG